MARTVALNGVNYSVPETSDVNFGSLLTTYLIALATAFPCSAGNAIVPAGTIDGTNKIFTLPVTPPNALLLFKAPSTGSASLQIAGIDYSIVAATITFVTAPAVGSLLRAYY